MELPSGRKRTGRQRPTPHQITICILLQLAILGREHMTPKRSQNDDNDLHGDGDAVEDDDDEEEEELDLRRRGCVSSVRATRCAPFLSPASRRTLLFWLLDEVTTLKQRAQHAIGGNGSSRSSSGSSGGNTSGSSNKRSVATTSTHDQLLATSIYYEPSLQQFIASIPPLSPSESRSVTHRRRRRPFAQYLLHRLKTAMESPDGLEDLLTSFQELIGDPRTNNQSRDGGSELSDESDPDALSDEDDSASSRHANSVAGGMPRYVERKSVLGLYLRRIKLETSRMLFDGLSMLYDEMIGYMKSGEVDDIYEALMRPVQFGTASTPQKRNLASTGSSTGTITSSTRVEDTYGESTATLVPLGWTNTLHPHQIELHVGREVWEMRTNKNMNNAMSSDNDPIKVYERNERAIAILSSRNPTGAVDLDPTTRSTMLKCLYLRHLNALEHHEYVCCVSSLFDFLL